MSLSIKFSAFLRNEHICVVTDVRFLIIEFMKILQVTVQYGFKYGLISKVHEAHGSQSFLNHNEAIFAMERLNTSKKSKKIRKGKQNYTTLQ